MRASMVSKIQGGYVCVFQQFPHEVTNRRTDTYGGSVENRARVLFDALGSGA
jgi:2,4-dienoyl-CoA reductase-like NADH-dependent reductase (Old Yellow Enzyme family)